jgi:hypothetical protein
MAQTREAMTQHLAERLCWQVARRDDARVARRLSRQQVVDGVYQLDEGARLADGCSVLPERGVVEWLRHVQGTAVQRHRVPCVQDVLLDRLTTWCGIERRNALPALLCSAEALMRLVGFHAPQVRHGVCPRGAAHRQGPRRTGPSCAAALADHLVQRHRRDLAAWCNGVIRPLATAGVCTATVTGSVEAPELETTAHDEGCGQGTRNRKSTATRGQVHESEVTVYGWQLMGLIEARTPVPWAATVGPIQEPATLSGRGLVTPARPHLVGYTRRQKVVFEQGCVEGVDRWWLQPHGLLCVVPAQGPMAVTVDAPAQAAAGAGLTRGHRVHTVRHGQGNTAASARLETEVVGIAALTTDDPDGTPAQGRHHNRQDCQPHPSTAVVVRHWQGRDCGPGGNTGLLTKAPVEKPLPPCDDEDARRLLEHGWITERTQPWSVKPPPQKTARAGRVHVIFTLLLFALATAYRLQAAPDALGTEPVGWPRWRRQLLEQSRDHGIVFARDGYGIVQRAEYSRWLGVRLKEVPPGSGTRQDILANYRLTAHG